MTTEQQARFKQLSAELFGTNTFVIADEDQSLWDEYNELMKLHQYERKQVVLNKLSHNAHAFYNKWETYPDRSISVSTMMKHDRLLAAQELEKVGLVRKGEYCRESGYQKYIIL